MPYNVENIVREGLLVTGNFSFSHNVFHSYLSLVHQNVALCSNGLSKGILLQNSGPSIKMPLTRRSVGKGVKSTTPAGDNESTSAAKMAEPGTEQNVKEEETGVVIELKLSEADKPEETGNCRYRNINPLLHRYSF